MVNHSGAFEGTHVTECWTDLLFCPPPLTYPLFVGPSDVSLSASLARSAVERICGC